MIHNANPSSRVLEVPHGSGGHREGRNAMLPVILGDEPHVVGRLRHQARALNAVDLPRFAVIGRGSRVTRCCDGVVHAGHSTREIG